ncbi:hypothetical protein Tco_0677787 [Tanacetum coccineum]|uniref:Uncharacterized protein n=1 Tax=Tanacetum coccineum TaxID=301880 RepID=A0ABQ4XD81_9ASTR
MTELPMFKEEDVSIICNNEDESVIGMLTPLEQYSQLFCGVLDRYPHSNCLRSSGNGANFPEKISNCPDPIIDDPVYTLKRDNARSSSVGVVGSMLTSFDGQSWLLTPSCTIVIDGTTSFLFLLNIGKLECIFRYNTRPFAK